MTTSFFTGDEAFDPPYTLRVITEPIPPAFDKVDREQIKLFQPLREPMCVGRMPDAETLDGIFEVLHAEFSWAVAAISTLAEMLLPPSRLGVEELLLRPVLLVGPPGAGKSRLCRRLADLLKWPYMPVACGGSSDAKQLSGTARGWASGEPMPLLRMMVARQTPSVFVLLDEIDKAGVSSSTAPPLLSLLLSLLEPETACRYRDGYLQVPCDLSRVGFWATANSLRTIPAALLSRFEVVYVPGPSSEHMPALVRSITAELEREWRLPDGVLPLLPNGFWPKTSVDARLAKRIVHKYIADWSALTFERNRLH